MAKRPLLVGCLLLILCVWLGRSLGICPDTREELQQVSVLLSKQEPLLLQGRVCERSEEAFHVTSITILQAAHGQSSIVLPPNYKIICKLSEESGSGFEMKVSVPDSETQAEKEATETQGTEARLENNLRVGSSVLVTGHFYGLEEAGNPGQFDALSYYGSQRVCGKVYQTRVLQVSDEYDFLTEGLYRLRCFLSTRVYERLPEREASVLNTVLLGESDRMDRETKNLYKIGGILHIAAISGLHVTLLAMGLYRLLRKAGLPMTLSYLMSGGLLILYGIMTGFRISSARAIAMFLVKVLAELLGRTYDMLIALGVVGAVMVLQNPDYLQDAGFLLSFGAVLGIGVVMPVLQGSLPGSSFVWRSVYIGWRAKLYKEVQNKICALSNSLSASLAVNLVILPVQLWFFFEVPVYSVLTNLLIIPTVKLLMILGILLMLVPWTGALAVPVNGLLDWYRRVCLWGQELPGYLWNPGRPQVWQMVVYYGLLMAALFWRSRKKGSRNWEKGCFWIMLLGAICILGWRPAGQARVAFLDVGQGDCICVETADGDTYLFDCGSTSESQVGLYTLKPYLKYRGIRQVDGLFLSHPDKDHCNGAMELLQNQKEWGITVKQVILPQVAGTAELARAAEVGEYARETGIVELVRIATVAGVPVTFVGAGDYVEQEDFRLLCLHPRKNGTYEDENQASQCFYLQLKMGKEFTITPTLTGAETDDDIQNLPAIPAEDNCLTLLLTGDVEGVGEQELLEQLWHYGIYQVDVLKVAHHGSRNASSVELLEQINPSIAIISCGAGNSYGHPHIETLRRLADAGVVVYRTPETGAVILEVKDWISKQLEKHNNKQVVLREEKEYNI